ncbi:WG repeat-containing protein [Chamaesiphon sp. OTE_75_metabat_556]|uniref:WG repeat-containing protein n=1 Tax=Chamaesiphon sp. OTE_75_metabat_556 TaxID=2964692 RepID=UPI00286CF5D7|nr:WG repeat-containing protein [Chamaesiphon sp. OTE_75_metabat_556]
MKLSFCRLAIVNFLAVCLLNIIGTQVTNLFSEIDANSTSPRRSEAIGTDRFLFMRNDKFGYIDRTGKIVILARYTSAEDFSEGLALVSPIDKKSNGSGYIDRMGKKVVKTETSSALTDVEPRSLPKFSNGLSPRLVRDLLGYEDKAGELVIPARYAIPDRGMGEYVSELSIVFRGNNDRYAATSINFHGGLAAVILPERCGILWTRNCYGYIDTTGKLVFKF